jgi:3'-5' exoribonuclease
VYRAFENGDFIRVEGTTQIYQGALQMIATDICRVANDEVNFDDFVQLSPVSVDQLAARLREILRTVGEPHLRALAECFLMDEEFFSRFTQAPAGVKNHHAYRGGLLEHVVSLMEVALRVCECYPVLQRDMLLLGVLLHDAGKIDELIYERDFRYSDEGQLVGHIVIAVGMLDAKAREAAELLGEPLAPELLLRLKHMIVSHHGEYEFGSPKLPMTLEAVALHLLDNLDAKLHAFGQLMRDDPTVDSRWTMYHPSLGRKLYKGGGE